MKTTNIIILIIVTCLISVNLTFLITYFYYNKSNYKIKYVSKDDLNINYQMCESENTTSNITQFVNKYTIENNTSVSEIIKEINTLFPIPTNTIEGFSNLNLCKLVYNKTIAVNKLEEFLIKIKKVENSRIEFNFLKQLINNLIKNIDHDIGESVKVVFCLFADNKFEIHPNEEDAVNEFIYKIIDSKFEYSFRYLIKYYVNIKNIQTIKIGNFNINLKKYNINTDGLNNEQIRYLKDDVITEVSMYHLLVILNWFLIDLFDLFYKMRCFSNIRGHLVNLKNFSKKFIIEYHYS
jgi:hypothetical protein